ncbi:MAG: T9SS type A sorting domain-containing protein [Sphingobacteriales bacterium]|nr:T9SS type A sorting domain-containing protein [Sphingobacteriales bacterium]
MNPVMITIPEPCHENWNNMTPVEQGRYCDVCSKEVKDFTAMNDEQMQSYLNKTTDKVCGHFKASQINRELITAPRENGLFKHLWKLLLPGFFFAHKAFAQKTLPQNLQGKDSVVDYTHKRLVLGMVVKGIGIIPQEKGIKIITGKVIQKGSGDAISWVDIRIDDSVFCRTDVEGRFTLKIAKDKLNGTIKIGAVGYVSQELKVKKIIEKEGQQIEIQLELAMSGGISLVNPAVKKTNQQVVKKEMSVVKEKYTVLNDKVKIYPNPVANGNTCSLQFNEVDKGEYTAILTNIDGRAVQQTTFTVPDKNYVFHLDLNKEVSAGAYLLRIMNKDGKLFYNGKIVLE